MTPSALSGTTNGLAYPGALRVASGGSPVVIVRWPEEAATLERLRTLGQPRLLLVAPNAAAPSTDDCDEDWIRLPAEGADMRVRISTVAARAARHAQPPEVKGTGDSRSAGSGWV